MTEVLKDQGYGVNRKRIKRLYQLLGIQAIGPKPNTSKGMKGHKIYPYLLRNMKVERVNQVWAKDLTYIPMPTGFMYLMLGQPRCHRAVQQKSHQLARTPVKWLLNLIKIQRKLS